MPDGDVEVREYDRRRNRRGEHVRSHRRRRRIPPAERPAFAALRRTGIRPPRRPDRSKVYYHVTRPEFVGPILSDGIRAQLMPDRIFLWDNLDSAKRYVDERRKDDIEAKEPPVDRIIVRVRLPRNIGRDKANAYGIPGGIAVHAEAIPPESIQGVTN